MDLVEFSMVLEEVGSESLIDEFKGMITQIVGDHNPNSDEAGVLAALVSAVRRADQRLDEEMRDTSQVEEVLQTETQGEVEGPPESTQIKPKQLEELLQTEIQSEVEDLLGPKRVEPLWSAQLAQGVDLQSDVDGENFVLIGDAIEGFRMFVREIPMWSISVAVARACSGQLTPICGVVMNPPSREIFLGLSGGGAVLLNERTRTVHPLRPSSECRMRRLWIGTHLSTSDVGSTYRFIHRLLDRFPPVSNRVVMLGSGQLALCYVAGGRLDAFLNISTPYYDVYAGKVILEAATRCSGSQSRVTDFRNQPWTPECRGVLATGSVELHEFFLRLIEMMDAAEGPRS
jgi:myo-inositol-1(or 4)-monophosphatase